MFNVVIWIPVYKNDPSNELSTISYNTLVVSI